MTTSILLHTLLLLGLLLLAISWHTRAKLSAALVQARDQVAAHQRHHRALGDFLVKEHKPGDVDSEAVAILDGYHVAARQVVGAGGGEPGETTLEAGLRLLKLAHARGAFCPWHDELRAAKDDLRQLSPETVPCPRCSQIVPRKVHARYGELAECPEDGSVLTGRTAAEPLPSTVDGWNTDRRPSVVAGAPNSSAPDA